MYKLKLSDAVMIKLNKTKLNELLYYITSDDYKNSLILKLIYIYGRNAREVFNLKPEDINLTNETILFGIPTGTTSLPLVDDIRDDLMGYIYDHGISPDEYVFREVDESMEIAIKKLNYYLDKTITSLNNTIEFNSPKLTTKDFKTLRGQHLYLDGTRLHTIHELYCNTNLMSTKDIIQYNKLNNYLSPCDTLDKVFKDNTDLNLYYDYRYGQVDLFTISDNNDEENLIIEIDYTENTINIIAGEEDTGLVKELQKISPDDLFRELSKLEHGNFKFINGLKIIKN